MDFYFMGFFMLGLISLIAGVIAGVKVGQAVQRRRRGKALDVFQKGSLSDLMEQLVKLHIIIDGACGLDFYLPFCLELVGFRPTARAYGSWLNYQLYRLDRDDVKREEMVTRAIGVIVANFRGSAERSYRFYAIASSRHYLSWSGKFIVGSDFVNSAIKEEVELYHCQTMDTLERKRVQKTFARAKKLLGTDKR